MSDTVPGKPLLAVVGPTGAGKSELALLLAAEFSGEIVNCDSLQVYRYLDIGTAKLSFIERKGIPHHLLDVADPDEHFSAGEFARRARLVLADISARGKLPVLTGGTGFYLRALLEGLFPGPERDERLRARLARREEIHPGSLHRLLARFDPVTARRIHQRDIRKLIRALEILLLTRKNPSVAFAAGRDPLEGYSPLKIGISPPRDELYARLDERCRRMFENGLLDEVRRILFLGFSPQVKPLESHGYRQALQHLRGELPYEETILQAQRNTRRYAKRQWTWFRQEAGLEWFHGFGAEPALQAATLRRSGKHLGGGPGPPHTLC